MGQEATHSQAGAALSGAGRACGRAAAGPRRGRPRGAPPAPLLPPVGATEQRAGRGPAGGGTPTRACGALSFLSLECSSQPLCSALSAPSTFSLRSEVTTGGLPGPGVDHRWDGERALSTAGPPVLLPGLPAGLPEGAQKPVALNASVNIHSVRWGAAADRGEDEEWTARPSGSRGLVHSTFPFKQPSAFSSPNATRPRAWTTPGVPVLRRDFQQSPWPSRTGLQEKPQPPRDNRDTGRRCHWALGGRLALREALPPSPGGSPRRQAGRPPAPRPT